MATPAKTRPTASTWSVPGLDRSPPNRPGTVTSMNGISASRIPTTTMVTGTTRLVEGRGTT